VPHVELSVTDPAFGRARQPADSSLAKWAMAAADAEEHCLVIDHNALIIAISASFEALLGLTVSAIGRPMVGGVMKLFDFGDGFELGPAEVDKTPPLLALSSGRLARGLMRVRGAGDANRTLDAISTPLIEQSVITGSLTFFGEV
jgi:hypothetical protein